jgi:HAE1 family hydrophobic/amphiphilic exporter-1
MMLVGIVVTNAIVLIDRVQNNRKKRGMDAREALVEGGRTRLRPILMTAIAAMLALFPLALGLTEGAIIAAELATVVIGGLFSSTLLTLLVVPVMYSLFDRLSRRRAPKPVEVQTEED